MKEFALCLDQQSELIDTSPDPLQNYLISAEMNIPAAVYEGLIKQASLANASVADLEIMFEARARMYDYDTSVRLQEYIEPKIVMLFKDKELKERLEQAGFSVQIHPNAQVYGGVGKLYIDGSEEEFSYAISTSKVEYNLAVININDFINTDELINHLKTNCYTRSYYSQIKYNDSLCDSANTRTNKAYCSACSDACMNVSIVQDGGKLDFNLINCYECGACVAACPSNALEFCSLSKDALISISSLYKNRKIISGAMPFDLKGALYFMAPIELFDELLLLHLVQISEHKLSILGPISQELEQKIAFINELSLSFFNQIAIERELSDFEHYEIFSASENNFRLNKKELFAKKLLAWFNKTDRSLKQISYKDAFRVHINSNCTLCSSCVAACKQGALIADEKQNAICFNASFCTGCGYCLDSCAESDCISISSGILHFDDGFVYKVLAKDELFRCLECSKEFATKKAVLKIANMLSANFANDVIKSYSLYCCADCKGKIMMLRQASKVDPSVFDEEGIKKRLDEFRREYDK